MTDNHRIRIWQSSTDYITLSYATVQVGYSPQGERIRDRLGLVHRIAPSTRRYPTGLALTLIPEELTLKNNAGAATRRTVLEWLEHFFRAQAELVVYSAAATLDAEGEVLTRNLAWRCFIESLPERCFGSLAQFETAALPLELELLVTEDGTFTDFSSLATYSAYSPARP
jgi:hypothetical protein